MSEPTDYHRKLAWVINVMLFGKLNRARLSDIAAVLASEGVVDPEGHRQLQEGWASLAALKDAAEKEVERLKALLDKGHASSDKRDDEICKEAHAEGMERAAKLLHDQGYFKSASAIRADKERGDE